MSFEKEVTSYYSSSFEIVNFDHYVDAILIAWTVVKFVFYIVPILELVRAHDKEQLVNCNVAPSRITRIARNWSIWMMLVPLVDCFIFFYIIVTIIGRIDGFYPKTVMKCQIYGISAGILNVLIISNFNNLLMYSSGLIFTGESQFFLAFNLAIFSAWALLSVHHLFHLYSLGQEVNQKMLHPEMFSDYRRNHHQFTAEHL